MKCVFCDKYSSYNMSLSVDPADNDVDNENKIFEIPVCDKHHMQLWNLVMMYSKVYDVEYIIENFSELLKKLEQKG